MEEVIQMRTNTVLQIGLLLAASLSLGCKVAAGTQTLPTANGIEMAPAMAKLAGNTNVFTSQPRIVSTSSMEANDGMSHVQVRVNIEDQGQALPIPRFRIQALPAAWSDALVTLYSATASTAYSNSIHRVIIPEINFTGSPLGATATFPPLRPATDYTARVFLRNDVGATLVNPRLAGSASQTGVTLNAGSQNLLFNVSVNGQESSYSVTAGSSVNNNVVTGGNIVKGDTVSLSTGIANNQAGIDHVDLVLSGAAYGGSNCILGRITTAGSFSTFSWNSNSNAGAPGTFLAASLVGGTNQATVAGTIDVLAYHVNDSVNAVATASIPVNIFGRPAVTVQVQ
jgi:hypothetical protein